MPEREGPSREFAAKVAAIHMRRGRALDEVAVRR